MAEDAELDADFALFEQEIAADLIQEENEQDTTHVEAEANAPTVASEMRCPGRDIRTAQRDQDTPPPNSMAYVEPTSYGPVDANVGYAEAQKPEWQRELVKRDYERMLASRALKSAAALSAASDPAVPSAALAQNGASAGGPAGRWVWTGFQWTWDASAVHVADAATPSAVSSAEAAGVVGAVPAANPRMKAGRVRTAAGMTWVDETLDEWPDDDFRIFVGDMAPDATNEELTEAFRKYLSFNMARIVTDKLSGECKGYGFVSFGKGEDMVAALREMNGKYVGSRPVKLKKSTWQNRSLTSDRKKDLRVLHSAGLISRHRKTMKK
jgi:RNA recognition motif. (a.k.a. RRM, RBD, or RNP domain)